MRRRFPDSTVWITAFVAFVAAVAVALMFLGGTAPQHVSGTGGVPAHGVLTHGARTGAGHVSPDGSRVLASVEILDSEETVPADGEHLSGLWLALFLVSLGLLLGTGLVGRGARRRLLELRRLPSVVPLAPDRAPLSALEVFRL